MFTVQGVSGGQGWRQRVMLVAQRQPLHLCPVYLYVRFYIGTPAEVLFLKGSLLIKKNKLKEKVENHGFKHGLASRLPPFFLKQVGFSE